MNETERKKCNIRLYVTHFLLNTKRIASHCFYLFIHAYWRFVSAITVLRSPPLIRSFIACTTNDSINYEN